MTPNKTSSPKEFLAQLKNRSLTKAQTISGLVKDDAQNPDVLMFSMDWCRSWVSLVVTLIEEVEYIRSVTCKDHDHPYVTLRFKQTDQPEANAAIALVMHVLALLPQQSSTDRADWWYWLHGGYEECARCINGCQQLEDQNERVRCIRRCPC